MNAPPRCCSRAFATDPGNVARYPDPAAQQTMLEAGMRGMFRTMARFGSGNIVGADGHLSAISLWHPPGVRTAALDLAMVLRPELAIVRQRARAIRAVSTVAVWHLAHVGAAPEHPGRGLARQLPDRQLARCDEAARLPSW